MIVGAANHSFVLMAFGGYRVQVAPAVASLVAVSRVAFYRFTFLAVFVAALLLGYAVPSEVPLQVIEAPLHVLAGSTSLWFAYGVLTGFLYHFIFYKARVFFQYAPLVVAHVRP